MPGGTAGAPILHIANHTSSPEPGLTKESLRCFSASPILGIITLKGKVGTSQTLKGPPDLGGDPDTEHEASRLSSNWTNFINRF